MTDPIAFALATVLLLAVPGPTNTVMATAGAVNRGAGLWRTLLAELAGYLAIVVLARVVLLPLVEAYPWTGVALKGVVVVYLGYAAFRLWRTRLSADTGSGWVSARLVFLTTALNPKGLIIAVAIMPRGDPTALGYFAGLAALIVVTGAAWYGAGRLLWVLAGRRASVLPRAGSLVLVGFAGYVAATLVA